LEVEIVGDSHGRDTESRQLSTITAQGENHGNHGDREFVIYIHPYSCLDTTQSNEDYEALA